MKQSNRKNRWIMGSALGAAAIAVAIDHTRHRLPQPVAVDTRETAGEGSAAVVIVEEEGEAPCGLDAAPCSLDDSPCSMDVSPCSLDES